jgi:hypothetical protein
VFNDKESRQSQNENPESKQMQNALIGSKEKSEFTQIEKMIDLPEQVIRR